MDITNLLKEKKVSKSELSRRIGIANQNLNSLLLNPRIDTIKQIAEALGVLPWELFYTHEEMKKMLGVPLDQPKESTVSGLCPHCGEPISVEIEYKIVPVKK